MCVGKREGCLRISLQGSEVFGPATKTQAFFWLCNLLLQHGLLSCSVPLAPQSNQGEGNNDLRT